MNFVVLKMKKREPRKKLGILELKNDVIDYFSETTVHGFKYLAEGRNVYEKLSWLVVIVVGFSLCSILIWDSSQVWSSDPVQTTLDEVSIPVHNLPFPAITVCDTESLQMPRRNRWIALENILNTMEIENMSQNVPLGFVQRFNFTII